MQQLPYFVVDAFASGVFKGNPAGICLLEDWLPDELMQSIAAENNLSETAFVVPRNAEPRMEHRTDLETNPEAEAAFELRWFTPRTEVPLCGHATLAAAYFIANHVHPDLQEMRFSTRSGVLTVTRNADWYELDLPLYAPQPVESQSSGLRNALSDALGTPVENVFATREDTNYYVVLDDEESVRRLEPRFAVFAELHPYAVAVTARGTTADFVSRYFSPGWGIAEDPVTGSTHAALVPYWAAQLQRTELLARQLSARGGELRCRLESERVRVAGQAVTYLEGTILVP